MKDSSTQTVQRLNNEEEIAMLKDLLGRAEAGESVIKIDDSDMYPTKKTDAKKYVMRRLKLNHDVNDIAEGLMSNYQMADSQAISLIKSCRNYLNKQYKDYAQNVAQKNIEILQQIVEESLNDGQRKTAIDAIRELNKICHLYDENIVVNNTTINSNAPIEIVFK